MSFQLVVFLYLYYGFVALFVLFSFFHIYHLVRFGPITFANIAIIVGYISISLTLLLYSWFVIAATDWSVTIELIPTLQTPIL